MKGNNCLWAHLIILSFQMCHQIHTRWDSRPSPSAWRLSPSWSPTRMVAFPSATTWSSTKSLASRTGGMSSHTASRVSPAFPVVCFMGRIKPTVSVPTFLPESDMKVSRIVITRCSDIKCNSFACSACLSYISSYTLRYYYYRLDYFLLPEEHFERDWANNCINTNICMTFWTLQRLPVKKKEIVLNTVPHFA